MTSLQLFKNNQILVWWDLELHVCAKLTVAVALYLPYKYELSPSKKMHFPKCVELLSPAAYGDNAERTNMSAIKQKMENHSKFKNG